MRLLPSAVRRWLSETNGSRKKLEFLLSISALTAGYLYVWVYQSFFGWTIKFMDIQTLLRLPIIALVVFPLVHHLWVRPDLLQRGKYRWRSIQFFQGQLPSKYIKERCQACVETPTTCGNFIGPESLDHVNYWFNDIWRGIIKKKFPDQFEKTFERGYTCKLVVGLNLTLGFFGVWAPV
jgi:hypothetical protein